MGTVFRCTRMLMLFYTQVVWNWAQNPKTKGQSCDYRFFWVIFSLFHSLSKPRWINIFTAFLRVCWSACVAVTKYYRIEIHFLTTLKAGRSPSISTLGFWWTCSWLSYRWLPSCCVLMWPFLGAVNGERANPLASLLVGTNFVRSRPHPYTLIWP